MRPPMDPRIGMMLYGYGFVCFALGVVIGKVLG